MGFFLFFGYYVFMKLIIKIFNIYKLILKVKYYYMKNLFQNYNI